MEHIKLLAIKFFVTLAFLYIVLGAGYDMAFGNVFLITMVVSLLSYVVGDMIIMPRTNNTIATISDFVLAFVIIYFMSDALTVGGDLFTASLISSVGLAVFEYMFHKYVRSELEEDTGANEVETNVAQLRAEASEELTPYPEDDE
ncbi:YndM family protein [Halobacillus sp. H74]|uniref:YndM family protein n=1 Tax=Halobacillus sp. H74 TaxID=3457436 RepID=UPI003FCC8423